MINLSRLSSLALDSSLGRIPRLLETQSRLMHLAPDSVQAAPVDGQIAIPNEPQLPARAQVFSEDNYAVLRMGESLQVFSAHV